VIALSPLHQLASDKAPETLVEQFDPSPLGRHIPSYGLDPASK
jgi:hypothetical protein